MKEYKIRDLNLLVDVLYKPRNRRIYIKVLKNNNIRITTPIKLSDNKIIEYLDKSYTFIKKNINNNSIAVEKDNVLHLFGQEYKIKEIDDIDEYVISDGEYIFIHKNDKTDINKLVYNYYKECLSHFVNRYLDECKKLLNINKVVYVKYKNVKTYFGICTPKKNTIGFACKLAKYEPILIKSVICHELCHFYFLNHQQGFYKILENAFPNYKYYQHKLRSIKYNDKY